MSPLRLFHIFVVDDNPADVYLLREAFKQAELNCEITVVEDGAEALRFIRSHEKSGEQPTPDLAVLDLNLPGNQGIEVLEAIRLHRDLGDLPVAVLTSSSAPLERAAVERLKVDRFLIKPPDLEEFLRIGTVLKELLLKKNKNGDDS